MSFNERTLSSGVILLGDDGRADGIRPRWGKVYAIGPNQKDVQEGQYVLVSHGRWTRGIDIEDETGKKSIRRIDPKDILLISDEPRIDDTISTANETTMD
jgi:hypothetical protein